MNQVHYQNRGAALVVAHPGHELRVHSWLELHRPHVFVLTDGSGHGDRGRLDSTAQVVERAGASRGLIFGPLTDRDAYRLILDGELDEVTALVTALVQQFDEAEVKVVVSDAIEGFNPVHDLCFVIAEAAVRLASRRDGQPVSHYDFLLEAAPDAPIGPSHGQAIRIELSDEAMRRKLESASAYAELRQEVERAMTAHGSDAFRLEVLRPVPPDRGFADLVGAPPFYELQGERRVAQGFYDRVLRFREHFLPLAEALRDWASRS